MHTIWDGTKVANLSIILHNHKCIERVATHTVKLSVWTMWTHISIGGVEV